MKRVIFISLLAAFIFSLLLAFSIVNLKSAQWQLEYLYSENILETEIEGFRTTGYACLRNGLLFLFGSLCTIALYVLFALKEFKVFQPYVDKYKAKQEVRRTARAAAREAKADANRQKRIEELQAELQELKKDE